MRGLSRLDEWDITTTPLSENIHGRRLRYIDLKSTSELKNRMFMLL